MELLEPYLNLTMKFDPSWKIFVPENAKNVSAALEGLCIWVRALNEYQKLTKNDEPKLHMYSAPPRF